MADDSAKSRFSLGARFGGEDGRLVLPLVISVTALAALGLGLVWLNIERTKLAFRARVLQQELREVMDLNAKLDVEREHLLSPQQLRNKASALGLGAAKPGQLRRLDLARPPGPDSRKRDSGEGQSPAGKEEKSDKSQ